MSKNNKSPGADYMINEFFKHCHIHCINSIVDFVNIVLYTGLVPTVWCLGIINQIYKIKCPRSDPDNYRDITLLSCACNYLRLVLIKNYQTMFNKIFLERNKRVLDTVTVQYIIYVSCKL